jgi:hypothetical protein
MAGIAVVALGGNALILAGQAGTHEEQEANAAAMARSVRALMRAGWGVVLVHGNGSPRRVRQSGPRRLRDAPPQRRLVLARREPNRTRWRFANGSDRFVAVDDLTDLWEALLPARSGIT